LQIEVVRMTDSTTADDDSVMSTGECSETSNDQGQLQKSLIRVLLKALGSATYASANNTRSQSSNDVSLPATLSMIFMNMEKFGVKAGVLPSSKALACVPNGLGAICLNAKGLEMRKLKEYKKIVKAFRYTIYSPLDGQPCADHYAASEHCGRYAESESEATLGGSLRSLDVEIGSADDIRAEVLAQQQAQGVQRSQELDGQPVEMDTVSIIATFPSESGKRSRRGESSRRGEGIGSSLDTRRSSKPIDTEGAPLVDTDDIKAMIGLLRVVQPLYKPQLQICCGEIVDGSFNP
nr:E3 ubiquitin-protein ligase UPL2-like isoform X1 [Tanacetum cinerariifolium]